MRQPIGGDERGHPAVADRVLNPTLVAATTVMLLLDKPARLMGGYLLGAYLTSITLGLVIVFSLSNSTATNTTENTISPAVDIGLGAIALAIAFVLYTGRAERLRQRRRERKADKPDKGPPRWQRELSKGSAKTTFVIGALLTLPGASYLAGLHQIHKLKYSTTATVLLVVGFNLGDAVAARGPPGVLPGCSRLDAAGDRESQTLGEPARPHVCRPGIHRRGGAADHQGRSRTGRVMRVRVTERHPHGAIAADARGFVLVSLLGDPCARRNVQARPSDLHVRLDQFRAHPACMASRGEQP